MNYYTGEQVKIHDIVEYYEGGVWVEATVIYISGESDAPEELSWIVDEQPAWVEGHIAIRWEWFESGEKQRYIYDASGQEIDQSILFTDTEDNDELRFIARKS